MQWGKFLLATVAIAFGERASALQPLDVFLRGARKSDVDNAEARALRRQAAAQADAALGDALPGLSLQGIYTRNQYETTLQLPAGTGGPPGAVTTITPHDQVDGIATLNVPLVDLSRFARIGAARTSARAAEISAAATELRVQAIVSQDFYQLLAGVALVESATHALEVARSSLRISVRRHESGTVPLLDVDRARAEVERNVQQVAAAELDVSLLARALQSATGVTADLQGAARLADDLHEEPPLDHFQTSDERIPSLASAIASRTASEQQSTAQRLTLVPSLAGAVTERVSNVTGFAGHQGNWQTVVGLSWSFDVRTLAEIRSQDAAADAARAREQRARLAARDDIHRAWMTVRTAIARGRSARIQAEVSTRASAVALDRYQAGATTQLDLLQAQRDAFAADAARIQADADLVNSRAQLRIAAGEDLLGRPARDARDLPDLLNP